MTLLSARETDHQIHLLLDATRVNVRPYKYPYYQKREIETQVEAMLQHNSTQQDPILFAGAASQEVRRHMAILYGLPRVECLNDQGSFPNSDN